MNDQDTTHTKSDTALIALRQILRATEISSRALAKQSGLTPSQLILMQVLARSGEAMPSTLAREVSLSQATVTSLIDKLVDRGLVKRQRDEADKRRLLVSLTEEGRVSLANAPGIVQQRFVSRFATMEEWEQSFLVAALERIAAMLDADTIDAGPLLEIGSLSTPTS